MKMKTIKIELNVDFMGGQGPLTEKEELALSLFFRTKKVEAAKAGKTPASVKNKEIKSKHNQK